MHILVFGGTGACGQAFLPDALQAGHELTLYVRNPAKLSDHVTNHPNVHIVEGQFHDTEALKRALAKGPETLVSFAGPDAPTSSTIITEFYERLYTLLPNSSVRRCMVLSTPSYKAPEDRTTIKWWFAIWVVWLVGGTTYQEINGLSKATAALPGDIFEWTIFRVPHLNNAEAKPVHACYTGDGRDGMVLSRKSIAVWVLQELQERKWINKAPALSNPGWI